MSEPAIDPSALLFSRLAALPRVTADLPAIQGAFKQRPEDFVVEEVPAYLPTGTGEHLYLWIEKTGLNTQDAVRSIARALGTDPASSGYAGLKDRNAVTRQWLSFHHTGTPAPEAIAVEGVRVLEVSRHVNKLRTGHLSGNRFTIRLTDVPREHDATAEAALARLATRGLPNYYGEQRFGRGGDNLKRAIAWVVARGRAPDKPFLRKLYVSTLQSALFNAWVAARLEDGLAETAILGDVLRKEESGGVFTCETPEVDAPRVESWEISPTGPMFGAKMRAAQADALARESDLLARFGVSLDDFARVARSGEGTRRTSRVRPEDVAVAREGDDLVLSFTLPKGSYATVLLAELTKSRDLTLGDDP